MDTSSFQVNMRPPPSSHTHYEARIKRVPVAPSMMYTYAHMKGPNKSYFDPLHHALYPASDRELFAERVWLPLIARRTSLEGLHKGAAFFWDPITCASLQPRAPLPSGLHGESYQPQRDRQLTLTYDDYIRQNPPSIGVNHYKGDMVYANFGYYLVEGRWVDPEGEGELYNAYMNLRGSTGAGPDLPDFQRSRDNGPRVMSPEEEDAFYKDFVEDVTDEIDGEGDPRTWRISSSTFAQWATGAVVGDQYEETVMPTPVKLPTLRHKISEGGTILPKPKPALQFDVETGSVLSGIYELDRSPALLRSPLGVDIIKPPAHFNYSYPQATNELERQGFGAAWCDREERGNFQQSIASTPEVFSSECAHKNLTHPEDPLGSYREYDYAKENICRLREQGERGWTENITQMQRTQQAVEMRIEISREVFFLKVHLEQTPGVITPAFSMGIPATLNDIPRAPSPPTPTPKRSQYRRFMNEAEEHENLQIARSTLLSARLNSEHIEILDDIRVKQKEKSLLLRKLGIHSIDDISGLMPKKKLSCENLRVEFHGL